MKQNQNNLWNEIKNTWSNSTQGEKINFQVSNLLDELKAKVSQFEKNSINSDVIKIKSSWNLFKGNISQFEKEFVKKDVDLIKSLAKKIVNQFRKKK